MKSTITDLKGWQRGLRSRVFLVAFAAVISIGAPTAAAQTTTFTGFAPGTVNYKAQGGCTTTTPPGYVIPSPYGSCWTVADEWGNGKFNINDNPLDDFDERVVDDGSGNMVWRFSNAVTNGSHVDQPDSPKSPAAAGETSSFLWNDRGPNHTAPVISTRAPATTPYFHGSFLFKSATGTAQPGLALQVSPTAKQGDRRNSLLLLVDTGTGLNIEFGATGIGGSFPANTTIATGLSYTDWHKIDIYVEFVDGLNGDGSGNDIVTVRVNDVTVHVDTTWETFWRTTVRPVGAVDALRFRAAGAAAPATLGYGFFFDDVLVDNANFDLGSACTTVCYVDDDGFDAFGGASPDRAKKTIQAGVNAVTAGGSVVVAPGQYTGDVLVSTALTLQGPRMDVPVSGSGRTALDGDEATIQGLLTVKASVVKINGFSFTNPAGRSVLYVAPEGLGAEFKYNMIDEVGKDLTCPPTGCLTSHTIHAVKIEGGADGVVIEHNSIQRVTTHADNNRSASAISVLDSGCSGLSAWSDDLKIIDNAIFNVRSTSRGAYGILVNRCSDRLQISDNSIDDLKGAWTHGIGLEGNTPNAIVQGNTISNLSSTNPASLDVVGVHLEANPGYSTIHINQNNLDGMVFGVAFHPSMLFKLNTDLTFTYFTPSVDATCNWFGDEDGPNVWEFTSKPVAYPALPTGAFMGSPGEGVGVNPGVVFNPWSLAENPSACLPLSQLDKQSVRDDLAALLLQPVPPSKKDAKEIEKAIEHLDKSLKAENWVDVSHPAKKKVFDEEKLAVERLDKVKDVDVSSFVARLVEIDRQMAELAIQEANAGCTDGKCLKEIEHAMDKMDKAAKRLLDGKPAQAIHEYGEAWKHAVKALEKAGKGESLESVEEVPDAILLEQNYPNPFNPSTTIQFELRAVSPVRLAVYDVMGRLVRVLVDATMDEGVHETTFDARDLASGTYIYRITTPAGTRSKVMLLMK